MAHANKEVILSGGSINSPQILLLSGIGPADQLRALNIPVVADIPGVGHNLQDHLGIDVYVKTKPSFTQFGNAPEGVAFVKTQSNLPEPDIQLLYCPFFLFPSVAGQGYTFTIVMVNVQSRGHLILRSTDPTQPPAIFANYLDHEEDRQTLVRGIKLARRLNQTAAFAQFADVEALPGSQVQSDTEMVEYVRTNSRTIFHPVGTCKMGHDAMAVVDEQLLVRGVEGLRVVDASIMPTVSHGNTNAPTIMIAEKTADLISHNVSTFR
jgi:choline dehydrogenase